MEDETSLSASLDMYKLQLSQVESTLDVASDEMLIDLRQLQSDLRQLIQLTEESLLSVKKARLLALLDGDPGPSRTERTTVSTNSVATGSHSHAVADIDAEFAAFQQAIADDSGDESLSGGNQMLGESSRDKDTSACASTEGDDSDVDSDGDDDGHGVEHETEDDLSGTKCRVPYSHAWGELTYHNAVILCSVPEQLQVRVLFCNPTHNSMRPCPFYLEGKCRFDDLHCRFSHGELVNVDDLEPYLEPDYSHASIGCRCLARDTDDIWYRGTIVELLDDQRFHVMFDANHREVKLDAQDVFPLLDVPTPVAHDVRVTSETQPLRWINVSSDVMVGFLTSPDVVCYWADSEEEDGSVEETADVRHTHEANDKEPAAIVIDDDDEEELPVYLWKPGQTTEAIGHWEQHTRGIGSKIMTKMGYVVGQGLGKNSEGRAEPVPIEFLPQGKSLDKIMELKQLAGDRSLYDVLRKQKRQQKKIDARAAKDYAANGQPAKSSGPVFDFINHRLANKKLSGISKGLTKHSGGPKKSVAVKHITSHDLEKKSAKHINVQLCKTHAEITNAEREIVRLRMALERNESRDQVIAKQIRGKLTSMQDYISQLKTSETFIKEHQMARNARDTLSKF